MGFIRGGLVLLTGVLLLMSLLAGNLFLTLALSLKYDNIKLEFGDVIRGIAETEMNLAQDMQENYPVMEPHCQIEENTEYVFKHEESGYVFVIPCEVVAQGLEEVVGFSINDLVYKVYYENYDCGFFDCYGKTEMPFFLVSEHARNYWQSKFYISLMISGVLILLMLLFIEHKKKILSIVGALMIISSLPFAKLGWLFLSFSSDKYLLQIFSILFTQAYRVFWVIFVTGIVVIALGIGLRFWNPKKPLVFGPRNQQEYERFLGFAYSRKVAQEMEAEKIKKKEAEKAEQEKQKRVEKTQKAKAEKVKELKAQRSSRLKAIVDKVSSAKKDIKKIKYSKLKKLKKGKKK